MAAQGADFHVVSVNGPLKFPQSAGVIQKESPIGVGMSGGAAAAQLYSLDAKALQIIQRRFQGLMV